MLDNKGIVMEVKNKVLILTALATIALLPINQVFVPLLQLTIFDKEPVNRLMTGQLLTLALVVVTLFVVRRLNPAGFQKYWSLGDWASPATKVRWLGIKEGESWRSVGLGFSLVITATTVAFMWMGVYQFKQIAWFDALPWVLLFSATNSFSEEMVCRFNLAAGLDGMVSPRFIQWSSAAIFGSVHFFGTPGGIAGVAMAGFLGWLLSKSVLETKGFGWAWLVHFLQDVVILFAMLG